MEDVADLLDVLVEEAERRRVREHQPGGRARRPCRAGRRGRCCRARRCWTGVSSKPAIVTLAGFVPCAVSGMTIFRRVLALAALVEVGAHQQQPGQLALAAGRRLEADRVEAGDLAQDLLQRATRARARPAQRRPRLSGCRSRKPGSADEPLVDARVVLHRARAERIEARVDAEVARRERGEVAQHLGLGELGQARRLAAGELVGHLRHRAGPASARARPRRPACDFS